MLYKNLVLYEDKYFVRVNEIGDTTFYYLDYDTRTADINMQFQHFHTFYEICIILCPKSMHLLEGRIYNIHEFDIVVIPPNMLHRTHYPEGDPCKRIIIQFNLPENLPGLTNECEKLAEFFNQEAPIFRFNGDLRKRIYRLLNDIFLISPNKDSMRNMNIHLKFMEFLTMIYTNARYNEYYNDTDMSPIEEKIYDITSYIHAHYTENLSLDSLAKEFYVSSCYLSHQFKDLTGFTLTDYIQMTRVRNVQSLLINTDTSITDAAQQCGFASFSQFNRVFQKHIGMSPSQFRKEHGASTSVMDK